jgi:hypothetical protein
MLTRVKIPESWRLGRYVKRIDVDAANLKDGDLILGRRQLSDMQISSIKKVDIFPASRILAGDVFFYGIYQDGEIKDTTNTYVSK